METEGWVCMRKTWGGNMSCGEGTRLCSLPGALLTCWVVACPLASAADWRRDISSTSYTHAVRKTQVTLCNQRNKQLWNDKTPRINKAPPHLAHSSAFPVFGTFSQYLFNVSFICFNSFQYSKTAAAETLISPISAILLLHDNLFSKLLPAPRSALSDRKSVV